MSVDSTTVINMDFIQQLLLEEQEKVLPPMIITNTRRTIEAKEVPINDLLDPIPEKKLKKIDVHTMWLSPKRPRVPVEEFPNLSWWPEVLCFEIDKDVVIKRLSISNRSTRMLTIIYGGLWQDAVKQGAGWNCYPHTRIIVAPGLNSHMYVRAKPRTSSPIAEANCGLQLVSAHMRDLLTGYYVVPLHVKFLNYQGDSTEADSAVSSNQIYMNTDSQN